MFKLVALLFLVTNGVQAEKPFNGVRNNESFPTKEACENYFNDDKGKLAKKAMDDLLAEQGGRIAVQYLCVQIEDNSI